MNIRFLFSNILAFIGAGAFAQYFVLDFDYNNDGWSVSTRTAELITDRAYQGKSLQLNPHTLVTIRLNPEAASTYKMTAYLMTTSGETHKSLVLPLTDNGVKVRKAYRVDNKQKFPSTPKAHISP